METRKALKEQIRGWLEEIDTLNNKRALLLERVVRARVEYEELSRVAFYRREREKKIEAFVEKYGKKHGLEREHVLLILEDSPELLEGLGKREGRGGKRG